MDKECSFHICRAVVEHTVNGKDYCEWHHRELLRESTPTPTLYTIPSLEWKDARRIDGVCSWTSEVFGGRHLEVQKTVWYDIFARQRPCTSIEDGKAQAEKHYMEQLGKCLEVWNG